jgi:histidinol-phosphate/aromatic aminotransferase/cobyric acid decarboxylase-like protein
MGVYGFPEHMRISVGTMQENERCIAALEHVLRSGGLSATAF